MSKNIKPQMGWANYHGHSYFCDGHESPEMYVQQAIALGMKVLGISSHAPVPFFTEWNMDASKLPRYIELMSALKEKYQEQIKLLTSLEVDYIPGMAGPTHERITSAGLDYVVGSVHFVGAYNDGQPFSIDDSTDDFSRGVNEIYGGDIRKAVEHYFNLQREMLDREPPDILGHMDKIRMHNRNRFFFDESASWYRQQIHDTLKLAAEKGTVVEINTKYFDTADLSFPSRDHFKWMLENKIPLTISSDAHHPDKLLSGFETMVKLLQETGFERLWNYNGGGFIGHKYDQEGIVWT